MIIIFLMLILIVIFAFWLIYLFASVALLAIVNLIIGGMIIGRIYYDKKNWWAYGIAILISLLIYGFFKATLARFLLMEVVQIILIAFILAQLPIYLLSRHKKIS